MEQNNTLTLEGVQLLFRNFEGRKTEYNEAGNRNFCVLLPKPKMAGEPDVAEMMRRDGWNVKLRKPRDPDDEPESYIQVAVGFKIRPPRLVMINSISRKRTILDEDTCGLLDWADIITSDLTIRARPWTVRNDSGIKAYLKTLFVIIDEDYLELKYAEDQGQWALPSGPKEIDYVDYIDGEVVERHELEAGE